jgi:hypothetical protein
MHEVSADTTALRARLLADALVDVVEELRLIDADDLIAYIRSHRWATITDLVESSTELFFRDGTLRFACAASFDVGWGRAPSVTLDMEFQGAAVTAFFTVTLGATQSEIDLKAVWFSSPRESETAATLVFATALSNARLLPAASLRNVSPRS